MQAAAIIIIPDADGVMEKLFGNQILREDAALVRKKGKDLHQVAK